MIKLINFFYNKILNEETIIIEKKIDLNRSIKQLAKAEHLDNELLAKKLQLKYRNCTLKKKENKEYNSFEITDDLIYFYPPNDGAPTMPFYYYKDNKLILSNNQAYQEIKNLDEILLEMVKIYNYGIDNNIGFNPYRFMLELQKKDEDYTYEAKLVITDAAIKNDDDSSTVAYQLNRFLDHFIGWNFGVSINRSRKLEDALLRLNHKAIENGLRENAGRGLNVMGIRDFSINGLQHYYLPTEYHIEKVKKRKKREI